ncbi:MAG: class I SAM-dependent methyltransferase [Gemmatimonadota bacterium]
MSFAWPEGFPRVPAGAWAERPLEELALKYDTVESHGWYDNLEPTVAQLDAFLEDGDLLVDYSGGTGILAERLLARAGGREFGILIVDSSPKFLRLALEKFRDEPRLAFRLIRYLKEERRLQRLEEVLEPALRERGADALVSTNAIHLYYDLPRTARSWARLLRPSGKLFVQSGNIRNPEMPEDEWIIDETVEAIHRAAVERVRTDPAWARYRAALDDEAYMAAHDALRRKYFLPVRPLSYYLDVLREAGLETESVRRAAIRAEVAEWYEFLSVYHEGVLGWVGGAPKLTGETPPAEAVEDRLELLRQAMDRVFGGRRAFRACWTYLTCAPRPGSSGAATGPESVADSGGATQAPTDPGGADA